ncbi:MAG: YigZ family protein [Candidatus Gracilibacteria bacterium]|nr:YigZ family protein [Candidatus Gracilibacteria bacterium]MDD2908728.1 YigZ family protein [Candidatus Gracilibacteria bacterium]
MKPQISFSFDDTIIPKDRDVLASNILVDRGSRYGYAFSFAEGKEDLKKFLKLVRSTKPFDSADHCSYAYRLRSPEGIIVEGKTDDGETGAGLCILRELKRKNVEQAVLVVSRHFGGIYLQADRYRNIVDVARMGINKM